jgi:copper chaperone CopZ
MKKGIVAFAVIAVACVGGLFLLESSTEAISSSDAVTAEFSVERLSCGSCIETIRQAVSQMDGVASVATDVAKGQTLVDFDPAKTDAALIAKVITEAGYPAQLYARENAEGVMTTDVDTNLYIAKIGERLVARTDFNEIVEQQRQAGIDSGQILPVQYLTRFAWMTILQRELLLGAAVESGVTVANAELDAYIETNHLATDDREQTRNSLLLDRYFKQQNVDRQANPTEFANLLNSLQKSTAVQLFDASLKQSLSGGAKKSGGCGSGGGGCCG